MIRTDVDMTSFLHQMPTGSGWTHIAQSYLSLLFTGIIKSEKERLISLFKCAGKFENGLYAY